MNISKIALLLVLAVGTSVLAGVLLTRHTSAKVPSSSVDPSEVENGLRAFESKAIRLSRAEMNTRAFSAATPFIPPQCYTKTTNEARAPAPAQHNPCYVCHNIPRRGNFIFDSDLQLTYSFGEHSRNNPWTNLFVDRRAAISEVSDSSILSYVRTSNLFDERGLNVLARALEQLPAEWDANENGRWDGYVPDVGFSFDERGFDRDSRGGFTGWRAYAYYPFQGTFWPTNGSAGDVLIRLPAEFRQDEDGLIDQTIYEINLAILEALFKERDVVIDQTNENSLGVDLDRDGQLSSARHITFQWSPREHKHMHFVGRAGRLDAEAGRNPAVGLFPVGTEIVHTVRYLDIVDGRSKMASRLKELRYAKKVSYRTYSELQQIAQAEAKEKKEYPDRIRQLLGDSEQGLFNGQGWRYQAFIEDAVGDLRPQTVEETAYCMGCHGGVSQTRDGIFSFSRKLNGDAYQGGWYHWSQSGLDGIKEPKRADGHYTYSHYLRQNGAADEFRGNAEAIETFGIKNGQLDPQKELELHENIASLLLPSSQRAIALNKAYRELVKEQSFTRGRDATLAPAINVHRRLYEDQPTGLTSIIQSDSATPGGIANASQ